jgi:hypothetical protein
MPPTKVLPKAGQTLRSINSCFANQLQLSGRRNSIRLQMLSSAIENNQLRYRLTEHRISRLRQYLFVGGHANKDIHKTLIEKHGRKFADFSHVT